MGAFVGYCTILGTANLRILLLNLGEFEQLFVMLQVIRCTVALSATANYHELSVVYNIILLIGSTSLLSIVDAPVASRRMRLGISVLLLLEYSMFLFQAVFRI